MGWLIKDSSSGMGLIGVDNDGYGQFSNNPNSIWWWPEETDANWFIQNNNLANVEAADAGSNPPGPGQPGQP